MRRLFIIALLATASCSGISSDIEVARVIRVSVTDINHKPISVISATQDLEKFNKLWLEKRDTNKTTKDKQVREFQYLLDIQLPSGRGGRWWYWTNGVTAKLDHKAHPLYQISDPQVFNTLLGLKE